MLTQNSMALEAQVEERPLAKKQEALLGSDSSGSTTPPGDPSPKHPKSDMKEAESPKVEKVPRKALLKNDDVELQRVGYVCISPMIECTLTSSITATWGSPSSLLYLI